MTAAIAAGHPATARAGAEILAAGGSAADGAVAASLASCVAETVMTGLLGGGHAIHHDAAAGETMNLDFFVAVPGLGADLRSRGEMVKLEVPFGTELVHYSIGPGSCGVPGVAAGLGELWRRHGRLEWPRLVEPALALARAGVEMPQAHASCLAMLASVMTMDAGARIYAPGGTLLAAGDRLEQPGLVRALELLAAEGPESASTGSLATALLGLMEERGGLVTRDDLERYRPLWNEPVPVEYAGTRFLTRAGLSGVPETLRRLPSLAGASEAERAVALADVLAQPFETDGHTTNTTVVDGDGNTCVVTTSLGLGSGDFVPGLDLHLNSMLGEADLIRGDLAPGERMGSMMAPSVALAEGRLALAAGAAGGTRLRSALVQVVAGVLDEGLAPAEAVERPRLHAAAGRVQLEPGFADETVEALARAGYEARVWAARHHFFGGVSVVTPNGAAGDPRRSGAALTLP